MRAPTGCRSSSPSERTSESEEERERGLGRARPSASSCRVDDDRRLRAVRATRARYFPDHCTWCLGLLERTLRRRATRECTFGPVSSVFFEIEGRDGVDPIRFDRARRALDSMVTRQHDARAHARPRTMDAQLSALAKAQDEFRNAVSVGLGEMRTAYEGVARESASEAKGRASERDAARRAIETSEQAREKLEQKLLQCEEALREAKGALVETREQAKDVRDSDSIRFRCARDRGDDFDDSRVERPRLSTA